MEGDFTNYGWELDTAGFDLRRNRNIPINCALQHSTETAPEELVENHHTG
jgi:hypothetical protein